MGARNLPLGNDERQRPHDEAVHLVLGFEFGVVQLFDPQVSGIGSQGIGFRIPHLGYWVSGFEVLGCGSRVSGFRASGCGFRISWFGFRVSGFGFRVSRFGFRGYRVVNLGGHFHCRRRQHQPCKVEK